MKKKIEKQLKEFLMSEEGYIPIKEALKKANKKWSKSKYQKFITIKD